MNEALVVMLALLWAVVLLPSALRSRRGNTHATVGGFERAMDVLRHQPDGRHLMVPADAGRIVGHDGGDRATIGPAPRLHREDPVIARRRATFTRLLVASAALLLLALLVGGFAWTLTVLAVAVTGGYTALLRHHKLRRDEVREVVREIRGDETFGPREERIPVAVGQTHELRFGVPVASHPDEPWQPMTGVRIRRWDD